MPVTQRTNEDQSKLWNGPSGLACVEAQPVLDQTLQPFTDLLLQHSPTLLSGRVLDVGCGAGGTTLALGRLLGERGHCVGIDISEPLIAAARKRAERERIPVSFICADAQTHELEPGSLDALVSRFGLMFFEDPVQAFANLRGAARDHAEFRFVAWRGPAENPFMTTAERAAAPLMANIPPRQPDGPGQFAFADRNRIVAILEGGGWSEIDIQPIDATCTFPKKELVGYFTRLGPLGRIIQEVDDATRGQIIETVRAAFDPYVHAEEVQFSAACWMVRAQALRSR